MQSHELDLTVSFDVCDAPTDPQAAERALLRLARATWRNKALPPDLRKYGAQTLLKAVRANRAAHGDTKKAQVGIARALNLSPKQGRAVADKKREFGIWQTILHIMEEAGVSRDEAIRALLESNHSALKGYTGRSIENMRRVVRAWQRAKDTDW